MVAFVVDHAAAAAVLFVILKGSRIGTFGEGHNTRESPMELITGVNFEKGASSKLEVAEASRLLRSFLYRISLTLCATRSNLQHRVTVSEAGEWLAWTVPRGARSVGNRLPA